MTSEAHVGYYGSLEFNNPMTGATADRLVAQLAATEPSHITDIGCGWAELLLRLLTACPGATGLGIDHDEILIERATGNAAERSLHSRVAFRAELGTVAPSDLVLCVGSEHVFGTVNQALAELHPLVHPGGRLLLGTPIWEQVPPADVAAEMGDVPDLTQLVAAAVDVGWRPLGLEVASPEDWDHFEFGFLADWEQVVMSAADPTEADDARRAADQHRDSYLRRRGIFGFAFLTLGRPKSTSVGG